MYKNVKTTTGPKDFYSPTTSEINDLSLGVLLLILNLKLQIFVLYIYYIIFGIMIFPVPCFILIF